MMPSDVRWPDVSVLTPWRMTTRYVPRVPATGRSRVAKMTAAPLLHRDRVAARLRARSLLDEQKLAAGVVDAVAAENKDHLQRKREVAVDILMQAVIAAGDVRQQERRRPRLPRRMTFAQERIERRRIGGRRFLSCGVRLLPDRGWL